MLAAIAAMQERCDRLGQLWATAPGAGTEQPPSLPDAPILKAATAAAAAPAVLAAVPAVGPSGRAGAEPIDIDIDIEMDLGAELPAELESFLSSVTDTAAGDLRDVLPL